MVKTKQIKKANTIEKQIGVVGVDSGQGVICDPCYKIVNGKLKS